MNVGGVLCICLVQHIFGAPLLKPEHDGSIQFSKEEKPGLGGNKEGQKASKELEEKAGIRGGIKEHHKGQDLTCGGTKQVGADTDKYEDCPDECPFFASNRKDTAHCTFVCVPADDCKKWNPNKPIADMVKRSKTCRGPMVQFCSEPVLDGTDSCKKCQSGFAVHVDDGQCYFQYWAALFILGAVVLVVLIVVVVWFVDFCCRETINGEAVERACDFRIRSKILAPKNAEGIRATYPIDTNLCKKDVAGPGMLLHFNFQAFLIFWPLVIAVTWTILACFHNELFILGTRKFGTPRHNCILVAWGYETQQRLMWTKVLFIAIVYVFSFVSFLLFGVRQYRIYQEKDAEEKTMKDFAAELTGLPELPGGGEGNQTVEDLIKKAVADATKKTVIGVSVAWNYSEKEDDIMQAIKQDQREREVQLKIHEDTPTDTEPPESFGPVRKGVYNFEKSLFGPSPEEPVEDVTLLLKGLVSSDSAFVVFNTEDDKNEAIEVARSGQLKLKFGSQEYPLKLEELECEPGTVNWHNYGDTEPAAMMRRFFYGFFCFYVPALLIWFFVFYVPYALSLYNFNYDNGAELPGFYGLVFTIVVVGGNATMYVVCDAVCDVIGFKYKDTKQTCYMLFYLAACMINVLLDMVVTYYTALKVMIGLDFRTYDGTRIADISSFTEQFETYAMQRSLAENSYRYAWPSTFLVPFLLEPFITVLIPFQIGKLIIRTHREVTGSCAEAYIAAFDFDLGRYADILLNVFLGLIILYFPGGYTWSLFYGMFVSHIVIYTFDHWRVLSAIPSIKIVSPMVDWWAQVTLGACCAMILSCGVFKMNCESYAGYCLKTYGLVSACTVAGVAHFIVHTLLIIYLIPALGKECEDKNPDADYASVAKQEANTWFSVNPVHCLRSKYISKDKPHCRFSSVGKAHLLEANPKIGCYFSDEGGKVGDVTGGFSDLHTAVSRKFSSKTN